MSIEWKGQASYRVENVVVEAYVADHVSVGSHRVHEKFGGP